jgi:SEC-C motif domain protein
MDFGFKTTFSQACPCGSGHRFQDCCAPYLMVQSQPATAAALMRSRYTAFTQGQIDYLIATHHPTQRTPNQRLQLVKSIQNTTWLGLRVLQTQQGQPQDRQGQVEFIAYYQDAKLGQIHERSRFVKQKDRWLYLDGDLLPPIFPNRNQPCWCGSGQRYKACHGR